MKKLVFGMFTLVIVTSLFLSFKKPGAKLMQQIPVTTTFNTTEPASCIDGTTLNGVCYSKAIQNIKIFKGLKSQDANLGKAASVWFTVDQISNINDLLTKESANSIPKENRADGVRFYFACDPPASGSTKLNVSIYMVSTRPRSHSDPPGSSGHVDYYKHNAQFLMAGEFGVPSYSINNNPGADLYNQQIDDGDCTNEPSNYVDNVTAHTWLIDNRYKRRDTINTVSEWFPICFIQYLFSTIHANNLGGLRVYLALGDNINDQSKLRDIFILVPTGRDKNNTDYNGCMSDLRDLPGSCQLDTSMWLNTIRKLYSAQKTNHNFAKINKHNFTKLEKYPLFYRYLDDVGGYDNGELCPYNCNLGLDSTMILLKNTSKNKQ